MPSARDREFIEQKLHSGQKPPITIEDYRAFIDSHDPLKNSEPPALPEVGAFHQKIQLREGLFANIAVPRGAGPFPVVIMIHGNGNVAGSAHSYRRFTRDFAHQGYLTITPDYRLGPEHPFPAGFDDSKFTAYWAAENAKRYHGDPSRMAIVGDSTGGGLAATTLMALHDESHSPRIKAAMLLEGIYDFYSRVEGNQSAESRMKAWLGSGYTREALKDPRISAIYGVKPGALPITFLMQGTADIVAPGTVEFSQALARIGIPYELHMIEGMPHDFMKLPQLDGCTQAQALMFDFLRRNV